MQIMHRQTLTCSSDVLPLSLCPASSTTCSTWGTGRVCWRGTATTRWTTTSGITWSSRGTLPTRTRSRWTQSRSPRTSTEPRTSTSKVPRQRRAAAVCQHTTWTPVINPVLLTLQSQNNKMQLDFDFRTKVTSWTWLDICPAVRLKLCFLLVS